MYMYFWHLKNVYYPNNPKYWDRQAFANSVDSDQKLQNMVSDQGLHCLPFRHINR